MEFNLAVSRQAKNCAGKQSFCVSFLRRNLFPPRRQGAKEPLETRQRFAPLRLGGRNDFSTLAGGAVGSGREVLLEEFGGGFEKVVGGYDAD